MSEVPGAELIPRPKPRPSRWVWIVLACVLVVVVIPVVGGLGGLMYMGIYGPETSVYTGNQIPSRFLRTMEQVGALDEDESVLYFYSDAMIDIKDGFCFVSDKKVVFYSDSRGSEPMTIIHFDEIDDLSLDRNESFFVDSQITVFRKQGSPVSFPVSSELDRDELFFDAVTRRISDRTSESADSL